MSPSLLAATAAGLLSFFSPCVLPLVPGYIANLAGASLTASTVSGSRRWFPFFHALSFVLGFTLVFAALGVLAGLGGSLISECIWLLRKIAGGLLVVFGLHLTGVFKLRFLDYEKRLGFSLVHQPRYYHSFATGILFSLGWTPCVGAVLSGILALAISSQTVWQGAYLLLAYSLGLGVPFLIVSLALLPAARHLSRFSRHLWLVSLLSGLLLIGLGVLIFLDKLVWFNQFSPQFVPGA